MVVFMQLHKVRFLWGAIKLKDLLLRFKKIILPLVSCRLAWEELPDEKRKPPRLNEAAKGTAHVLAVAAVIRLGGVGHPAAGALFEDYAAPLLRMAAR